MSSSSTSSREDLFACLAHESRDRLTGGNSGKSLYTLRAEIHTEQQKVVASQRRIQKYRKEIDSLGAVMRRRLERKANAPPKKQPFVPKLLGTSDGTGMTDEGNAVEAHGGGIGRKGGPFSHSVLPARAIPFTKPESTEMKGVHDMPDEMRHTEWGLRQARHSTEISRYIDVVLRQHVKPFPKAI